MFLLGPTLNQTFNRDEIGNESTVEAAAAPLQRSTSHRTIGSRSVTALSQTRSQISLIEAKMRQEQREHELQLEQDRLAAEELRIKSLRNEIEYERKRLQREAELNELHETNSNKSYISVKTRSEEVSQWVKSNQQQRQHFHPEAEFQNAREPAHGANIPSFNNVGQNCDMRYEGNSVNSANGVNQVLSQAIRALSSRGVKDLPPFSGDIMDWPIFENEFTESTVEFGLSDRENLRRLIRSLSGKARKVVEPLLNSHSNVNQIMKILRTNFGRTEWIVSNKLETLRQLRNIDEGNIESFRYFYNAVIGTSIALKNAKADAYLLNPELISHVADKLPHFSKQVWIRHKSSLMRENYMITFDTFVQWLEEELEHQLASMAPVFSKKPSNKARAPVMNVNVESQDTNRAKSEAKKCLLCKSDDHSYLGKCDQFKRMDNVQRRSTARTLKACYICLNTKHSRAHCKSKILCSICKKSHHTLLHLEEHQMSANVNSNARNVLLRIGKIRLYFNGVEREVFALFDEGSSLTMFDENLAKEMKIVGTVSPITYRWTNGMTHKEAGSMMVEMEVSGPSSQSKRYKLKNVRTVKNLRLPKVNLDIGRIKQLYPMLDEGKLHEIQHAVPQILIGSNTPG